MCGCQELCMGRKNMTYENLRRYVCMKIIVNLNRVIICKTFSVDNKRQQKNLIETIKQNCRRIVKEKTGKKPFTNINIARI